MDGEVIPADAVVIAMGPWSGQAAKWGLPVGAGVLSRQLA